MSTPETAILPDLSQVPEALREPIAGVSLAAYLIVEAARLDELPVPRVLAWLGLPERAFARAEERWSERIDEELGREDGAFDERYQDLLGRALALWPRPVDPLDREIEAWMSFQRHALESADPGALARRLGLLPGDELRLARLWRERLSSPESPELAARAQAAWSAPLLPLPRLTLAPLVFPPKETA